MRPRSFRPLLWSTAIVAAALSGWLLFSDAGGVAGSEVVSLATDLGQRFERRTTIDLVDRADLPGRADQIGHAVLWFGISIIYGLLRIGRGWLPLITAELCILSLASEVAQPLLSQTRTLQTGDAVANLFGVLAGTVVLASAVTAHRVWAHVVASDR